MIVAHTVLALGEQNLPNLSDPFAWLQPALTRCPARHPIALDDDVVRAAAGAYLTVYRDAPAADTPHPAATLLLDRANRSIGPPTPRRSRRPPKPAPPVALDPPDAPASADPAVAVTDADAEETLVRRLAIREQITAAAARKRLREIRAQALAATLTGRGACTHKVSLWTAAEASLTASRGHNRHSPEIHAALGVCGTCRAVDLCRRWASTDRYDGIAAGAIYRDGTALT